MGSFDPGTCALFQAGRGLRFEKGPATATSTKPGDQDCKDCTNSITCWDILVFYRHSTVPSLVNHIRASQLQALFVQVFVPCHPNATAHCV